MLYFKNKNSSLNLPLSFRHMLFLRMFSMKIDGWTRRKLLPKLFSLGGYFTSFVLYNSREISALFLRLQGYYFVNLNFIYIFFFLKSSLLGSNRKFFTSIILKSFEFFVLNFQFFYDCSCSTSFFLFFIF